MGSATLCSLVSLYGMLKHGWLSFKLLKYFQLQQRDRHGEAGVNAHAVDEALTEAKRKEMRMILQFWTVFAVYSLYEFYLEVFVFWIPFYYSLKLVSLLWLMLPQAGGSAVAFEVIVEPIMKQHGEWFRLVLLPAMHSFVCSAEAGLVGSVKSVLSKEKLMLAIEHFENLLGQLRGELEERNENSAKAGEDHTDDTPPAEQQCSMLEEEKGSRWPATLASAIDGVVGITKGTGEVLRRVSMTMETQEDTPKDMTQQVVEENSETLESDSEDESTNIWTVEAKEIVLEDEIIVGEEAMEEKEESCSEIDPSDTQSPSRDAPKYLDSVLGMLKGMKDKSPLRTKSNAPESKEDASDTPRKPRRLPQVQSNRPMTRGYSKRLRK